jgi:hypothetical protein
MHSERITILATTALKAKLTAQAKAHNMSVGEFIRKKLEGPGQVVESLTSFMQRSPLAQVDLKIEREKGTDRKVDL